MSQDRNFDDLAEQFGQRIYQNSKGRIRLALLARDCQQWMPQLYRTGAWHILDAGGGEGRFAQTLAPFGHHITLCDQSQTMLDGAEAAVTAAGLDSNFTFQHSAIQALPAPQSPYDLVLCHAVLEWVEDPRALLHLLTDWIKPGGYLSLMFFNQHSTVFRRLVRGYFKHAEQRKFKGSGKGLTPINPLLPADVLSWLDGLGYSLLCHSGVRVFHDYMHFEIRQKRPEEDIIKLELEYSQQEPYRSLGRYIHLIAQRKS